MKTKTRLFWLMALPLIAIPAESRTLFDVTFDDPPHSGGIASDHGVTPPANQPWEVFGLNSITNYPGMSGPCAFIDLGWLVFTFNDVLPPYSAVVTSGVSTISWKVAFTQWSATNDNPASGLSYQWSMRTESLVSGDPFITLRFEYFGGTAGVVRISTDGYLSTYKQFASFTTGVTYDVAVAIDLDEDCYSVWFDGVQMITNEPTGSWQAIMQMVMIATAEGDRVIDDVRWTVLDRPKMTLDPSGSITWGSDSGTTYRLEARTDMSNGEWTNTGVEVVASNVTTTISEPPRIEARQFYRLNAKE